MKFDKWGHPVVYTISERSDGKTKYVSITGPGDKQYRYHLFAVKGANKMMKGLANKTAELMTDAFLHGYNACRGDLRDVLGIRQGYEGLEPHDDINLVERERAETEYEDYDWDDAEETDEEPYTPKKKKRLAKKAKKGKSK